MSEYEDFAQQFIRAKRQVDRRNRFTRGVSQQEESFISAAAIIGSFFGLVIWSVLLIFGYSTFLQETSSWPTLVQLLVLVLGLGLLSALWFGFGWVFEKIAVRIRLANENWIRRLIREELLAREAYLIQHKDGR